MVIGTELGEVFLKLIIMSLVFDKFNWRKDSSHHHVIDHRPMLILLSSKETNNHRIISTCDDVSVCVVAMAVVGVYRM